MLPKDHQGRFHAYDFQQTAGLAFLTSLADGRIALLVLPTAFMLGVGHGHVGHTSLMVHLLYRRRSGCHEYLRHSRHGKRDAQNH
ncbi:hypothetical protein [Pseudomonas sp. SCT]|uniref:hypothetical protein n=1 Tax=Pseudomonas sp. (strain SCT) TaxID=412955 RepID=UPI001359A249|nr:hypothetical protein [Pseudomonas sp. SCT]